MCIWSQKFLIIFIFVEIQAFYSTTNLFTYSTEKVGPEHSSFPQPLRVKVITPDELVIGPLALGITFEFWENLVIRYLRNPNLHDHKILHAIEDGDGGLIPKEFTKRECLYLTLTSILRQEEIKFHEQSLLHGFDPYSEEEWPYPQRYPSRRFAHINYTLVPHPDRYLFKFAEVHDLEHTSVNGASNCTFHEPKAFRARHSKNERLTLDCCQGISSRRIPPRVHSSYHLHWISEYTNAYTLCQEDVDEVVIDFFTRAWIYHHRPRYHPVFFAYEGCLNVEYREVWRLKFVNPDEGVSEEDWIRYQFEPRPSRKDFFLHIIEQQHLWYNHTDIGEQGPRAVDLLDPEGSPANKSPPTPLRRFPRLLARSITP